MAATQQSPASASAERQAKTAGILMIFSYVIAGVAFALSSTIAFKWVCLLAVGGPTAAGFIRHFFLWRGDANRLGFETKDPSWMWEVAFANLAIFLGSVIAFFMTPGLQAQQVVTVIMGIYMLGATFVHLRSNQSKAAAQRSSMLLHVGLPALYALVLFYMAWKA